ncbi:hypothetical protein WJX84_007226 [Apatococcus fuscideae]|uniref:PPM-type phosphatase domain-containing protein n=1 Tax=Apatococcus fuscideae TaxID=2026836 RepID=A0AAW1THT6_9CHLO
MEDTAVVIPRARCGYLFAAVFDGHSGSKSAEYLSKELYTVLSEAIDDNADTEECVIEDTDTSGLCCPLELSGVLRQSFVDMDIELLKWLQEHTDGEEVESGATATVVLARKDKVVIANVGDSRAVLSRNGKPVDLSAEHRVSGKSDVVKSEIQRVKAAGGWVADGRVCDLIAVSRAFGDRLFKQPDLHELAHKSVKDGMWPSEMLEKAHFTQDLLICQPDVTELALSEGDEFLILATDGLWDVISSKDAVKIAKDAFQKKRSCQEIADLLTERAYRKYSSDNVAVIVIDFGGPAGGWEASKPTGGLRGLFQ